MKLDLHTHTTHSFDGHIGVEELIARAEESGLDAVAICDHETMWSVAVACALSTRITIIPGMEIMTDRGVHIIGLFLKGEIVSRDILGAIDEIHRQDGLVFLPHPYHPHTGLIHGREHSGIYDGEGLARIMPGIDLIEVANLHCSEAEIIATHKFLNFHSGIPQAVTSNAHELPEVGKAFTIIEELRTSDLTKIKNALLQSERTLRYEVYNAREEHLFYQTELDSPLLQNVERLLPGAITKMSAGSHDSSLRDNSFGRGSESNDNTPK